MQENRQEKSPIKARILQYLENKGISAYVFYRDSGVTRGVLGQDTGISEDNIARFLAYADDVSFEWLLTGRGLMLRADEGAPAEQVAPQTSIEPTIIYERDERDVQLIATQQDLIKLLKEQVRDLQRGRSPHTERSGGVPSSNGSAHATKTQLE